MKIRVIKPVPPIKINNHWVYRVDDTIEIGLDDLIKDELTRATATGTEYILGYRIGMQNIMALLWNKVVGK